MRYKVHKVHYSLAKDLFPVLCRAPIVPIRRLLLCITPSRATISSTSVPPIRQRCQRYSPILPPSTCGAHNVPSIASTILPTCPPSPICLINRQAYHWLHPRDPRTRPRPHPCALSSSILERSANAPTYTDKHPLPSRQIYSRTLTFTKTFVHLPGIGRIPDSFSLHTHASPLPASESSTRTSTYIHICPYPTPRRPANTSSHTHERLPNLLERPMSASAYAHVNPPSPIPGGSGKTLIYTHPSPRRGIPRIPPGTNTCTLPS